MNRTVTNQLGTFDYQTTELEGFVERLSREWGVRVSDLHPVARFSPLVSNYELFRTGSGKNGDGSIKYFRRGKEPNVGESMDHEHNARRLYSGESLESEAVLLDRGKKHVAMRVEPGKVHVTFEDKDALAALRETETEGLTNYLVPRTDTTMEFHNTATREDPHKSNPLGDMQAAFSVVRKYFSKQ